MVRAHEPPLTLCLVSASTAFLTAGMSARNITILWSCGTGVDPLELLACRSSTSLGGTIATMFIYGYCLLQGATYLADGSEMLLEILDPGLIGGTLATLAWIYMILHNLACRLLTDHCRCCNWDITVGSCQTCSIAGLLLPILGSLPDALIIIVSGLGGTRDEAQEQVSMAR